MAETDEPGRPKPSAPGYLPRLWKAEPETEFGLEEPLVKSPKKSQDEGASPPIEPAPRPRKKKKVEPEIDDGTGATKLEETPVLDTYEARQRARWIIGGIVSGVALIALILVLRAFKGGEVEHPPEVVINPKIESASEEVELTEGCLSVPGMVGEIARFKRIAVSGLDRNGDKIRLEGEGLFAQCLQHEIGHLNGELYIDKARDIRPATRRTSDR